ncbi:uncharacterized protein LOC144582762 [Callithrix jacchus]
MSFSFEGARVWKKTVSHLILSSVLEFLIPPGRVLSRSGRPFPFTPRGSSNLLTCGTRPHLCSQVPSPRLGNLSPPGLALRPAPCVPALAALPQVGLLANRPFFSPGRRPRPCPTPAALWSCAPMFLLPCASCSPPPPLPAIPLDVHSLPSCAIPGGCRGCAQAPRQRGFRRRIRRPAGTARGGWGRQAARAEWSHSNPGVTVPLLARLPSSRIGGAALWPTPSRPVLLPIGPGAGWAAWPWRWPPGRQQGRLRSEVLAGVCFLPGNPRRLRRRSGAGLVLLCLSGLRRAGAGAGQRRREPVSGPGSRAFPVSNFALPASLRALSPAPGSRLRCGRRRGVGQHRAPGGGRCGAAALPGALVLCDCPRLLGLQGQRGLGCGAAPGGRVGARCPPPAGAQEAGGLRLLAFAGSGHRGADLGVVCFLREGRGGEATYS